MQTLATTPGLAPDAVAFCKAQRDLCLRDAGTPALVPVPVSLPARPPPMPTGNVTTRTDTDGTVTAFGYDYADQLTSEVRDNSHSTGYSLGYSYDHNANRLTKVVGTGGGAVATTNTYGTHDQLLTSGSKSYGYDNNGNCTSVTVGTSVTAIAYDPFVSI